jgi:DNA-binding CsgD family transcriptional regulator
MVAQLSPREIECLAWAAQGKTYKETGAIIGLSFGAIKTYLDAARHKLGAVNVTHAVALAITYGHIVMKEEARIDRFMHPEKYYGEIGIIR